MLKLDRANIENEIHEFSKIASRLDSLVKAM